MSIRKVNAWRSLINNFLPELPKPHGNLKYAGFLAYARKLSDKHKTMLRRMLACLDMHGILKQDYKMTYALYTRYDKLAARIRNKNRKLFEKLGLVRPGDGKHIHHIDGDITNNMRSNLAVVDGKKHKSAHAKSNHVANATCALFLRQYRRLKRKTKAA